ncbi:MAG: hypothetical protein EOP04_30450, partial [Proteobacteria bacterium]
MRKITTSSPLFVVLAAFIVHPAILPQTHAQESKATGNGAEAVKIVKGVKSPIVVSPPSNLTSVLVRFDGLTKKSSTELLEAKVSFSVKNASFLTILDSIITESGKKCTVECRNLKPIKVSFAAKEAKVAELLDGMAKASGARLYVFPSKVLIAPPESLSEIERKDSALFGDLILGKAAPTNAKSFSAEVKKLMDVANTNVSLVLDGKPFPQTLDEVISSVRKPHT